MFWGGREHTEVRGEWGLTSGTYFDHLQMLDLETGKTVNGEKEAVGYRSAMKGAETRVFTLFKQGMLLEGGKNDDVAF